MDCSLSDSSVHGILQARILMVEVQPRDVRKSEGFFILGREEVSGNDCFLLNIFFHLNFIASLH